MKSCELCRFPARMYCESDLASLCWDCDAKVHSANFLVARHSRSLLCHVCQSPTAWSASGAKLGRTVSVCQSCADDCDGLKDNDGGRGEQESGGRNNDEIDTEDDYDEGDDQSEDEDELSGDDDEDGDNQVVPWSSSTPPPPPPPSSSSSGESSSCSLYNADGDLSLKRMRENAARSDEDHGCSSSRRNSAPPAAEAVSAGEGGFVDSLRPMKNPRIEPKWSDRVERRPASSKSAAIVESLERFHQLDTNRGRNASAVIVGICKLSKNPEAPDLYSPETP
ncbi:histone deacetylase HDT1-like [Cornus florida]|uniref:histone deacetylase HDT1-like n=1 Tax=Cornus florida TaxID=4283 RepID=UPI00289642A8|nr:histone deacetylase HDT1-like [Cornus florida]